MTGAAASIGDGCLKVTQILMRMERDGLDHVVTSSAREDELAFPIQISQVKTTADDVENPKPDPDTIQVAISTLVADVILLGDTPDDAQAGKEAGFIYVQNSKIRNLRNLIIDAAGNWRVQL
jgi:phosphoglycolate phosphatase-like HAD superfamily hydrolase